jgi:transposase
MRINTLAIDLAKETFQLYGVDDQNQVIVKKRVSREKFYEYVSKIEKCIVVMEACGGSHYWGRRFLEIGHEVRLISPQYVKPYVLNQKNDPNDARGILEASRRPQMKFVSVKEPWQQEVQGLHRVRERIIADKVAVMNQIRGLLLEFGITIPKSLSKLKKAIPVILEDSENGLSGQMRELILERSEHLESLEKGQKLYAEKLGDVAKVYPRCQKLMKHKGVGPLVATAFAASVGRPQDFKNGRQCAAWLGLVPRQHSSGARIQLHGITKRGDNYLRKLVIHGARSAVAAVTKKKQITPTTEELWIKGLVEKKGMNKASVAMANKITRKMWLTLAYDK